MVMRAVEMAVWQKQGTGSSILHSDRGSQFTSGDYQRLLKQHDLISSNKCGWPLCRQCGL